MSKLLDDIIKETQFALTPVLENYINNVDNSHLIEILSYCLKAKESYDRALFVRLAMESVDSDWHKAVHAMAAVELMDFSVLAIDDILDESSRRMMNPTVFKKWGEKYAIIAASILKSIAVEALIQAGKENNLKKFELTRLVTVLEQAHKQIYIGQYRDITYEKYDLGRVTLKMYLNMIRHTTGTQLSASSLMGGILGFGNQEEINALKTYGMCVGMIFQVRDDLIDYLNEEPLTGKPPFVDLERKKKRLPLLIARRVYGKDVEKLFEKLSTNPSIRDEIIQKVTSKKVVRLIKQVQSPLASKALTAIESLKSGAPLRALREIIELGTDI
jgi:geranylgeranyl pyrophosphate synthase